MQMTQRSNEHDDLEHVKAAINMFIINIEIYEAPALQPLDDPKSSTLVYSICGGPPDTDTDTQKQHLVQGETGCLDLVTVCQHLLPVLMSSTTVCRAIDGFANWQ